MNKIFITLFFFITLSFSTETEKKEISTEERSTVFTLIDNVADQFKNGGKLETKLELLEELVNHQEHLLHRIEYLESRKKLQNKINTRIDDENEMKSMMRKYKLNHKKIIDVIGDIENTNDGVNEEDIEILKQREMRMKKTQFGLSFIVNFVKEVVVYFFKCLGISVLFLIFLILFLWLVEAIRDRDLKKDVKKE